MKEVDIRVIEKNKIECARRHFAALCNTTVKYDVVTSYKNLYDIVAKD